MVSLKVTDEANASSSILIPFDAKWEREFDASRIGVVFRKRAPTSFSPEFVYVYVTSPASRLIGRVKVKSLAFRPLEEAIEQATKGGLTALELTKYAGSYRELAIYTVGAFEKARSPLSLRDLQEAYSFFPPQSILRLSLAGKEALDTVMGLSDKQQKLTRRRNG